MLIHAVTVAIAPVLEAFQADWAEATLENLLDDGLVPALTREGGVTPPIVQRICDLASYGARAGADGVLFTCSAFTPAIDVAKRLVAVPVLKPDEAMFAAALEAGRRVGVVATNPSSAPAAEAQLHAAAAGRGEPIEVRTAALPEAFRALTAGDVATHDRLVVEAVERLASTVDAICLAQFSMARAAPAAQARVAVPVLTSPRAAVRRLKAMLTRA